MRHTLADYRGAITSRILDPEVLPLAALDYEINQAVQDVFLEIRDAWHTKTQQTVPVSLRSNIDVYPLPDECGDLTLVQRIDDGGGPVRVYPVDFRRTDEVSSSSPAMGYWSPPDAPADWVSTQAGGSWYSHLPDRKIRLHQVPTLDAAGGLLLTFYPRAVPLVKLQDAPNIPDEIHEVVVGFALQRLAQHRGVQLANMDAVDNFIGRQHDRLVRFLSPSDTDRQPNIADEDTIYQEV